MAIKENNRSHKELQRKSVMRGCLVRFVESVRLGEFGLVVLEASLLTRTKYAEFIFVNLGEFFFVRRICLNIGVRLRRKIAFVV